MQVVRGVMLLFLSLGYVLLQAQFPGPAGTSNTSAIHKDSSIFKAWANKCTVQRGWMNIANKGLGKASVGDSSSALGKPGQNGIVSLGDSGIAIVQFEQPIKNGPGADFAIFENSFSDYFLELAFVEVSSNGLDWVRFSATCNHSQDTQIGPFDATSQPRSINNLAGKYRAQFGTPFDLEELKDSTLLNLDSIVYIKLIDAIGSINPGYGLADQNGNWVNDPFPTPFASSGFDLDAIGVMHENVVSNKSNPTIKAILLFPNPTSAGADIQMNRFVSWQVFDLKGSLISQGFGNVIPSKGFKPSLYFVRVVFENKIRIFRVNVSD